MSKNASRSDPTTKVLVVDDEIEIRRFLLIGLEAYGYKVIEARNGKAALQQAVLEAPNLMILDLSLPDIEGYEVVKQVRDWSQMPIVVLSVRSEVGDKIRALDAGANDYVVKPFDIRELMARVRAQLREYREGRAEPVFEAAGLRIDFSSRAVTLDDSAIHLTKKEFDLLALLVRNAGRVVTHTQILDKLWGPNHPEATQYLRVYVRQLREKLKDSSAAPRFLVTVPGVGYRFKD